MKGWRNRRVANPSAGAKPSPKLFQRWARAPAWNPKTGTALAFGLDPDTVVEHSPSGYDNPRLRAPETALHFVRLARQAVIQGDLDEHARPVDFMAWAESVGVTFHRDWKPSPAPRFSMPALDRAYKERMDNLSNDEPLPTEPEDIAWAKENHNAPQWAVKQIRSKYRSDEAKKGGRPRRSNKT